MATIKISDDFEKIFLIGLKKDEAPTSLLKKANDKYNSMVADGTIKKRGYTLLGIEDRHLFRVRPNGQ